MPLALALALALGSMVTMLYGNYALWFLGGRAKEQLSALVYFGAIASISLSLAFTECHRQTG